MIKLSYSNSLSHLVSALVENIEQERAGSACAAFHVSNILVPNRNLETYIKFEIAKLTGIAANLKFHLLESFLKDFVEGPGPGQKVLDRPMLQSMLVSIMQENKGKGTLPEQVESYLFGDEDELDLRIFQLSGQLSTIFEQYGLHRPEMLAKWESGLNAFKDGPCMNTERWQAQLWRLLFDKEGKSRQIFARNGTKYLPYKDLLCELKHCQTDAPQGIHLFGFSYISKTFNDILQLLAQTSDIHLYTVNPCMEFWEDVTTMPESFNLQKRFLRRSDSKLKDTDWQKEDPFDLQGMSDPPALRLWGRPGRENVRLLNERTECDFSNCFDLPAGGKSTLLEQLQRDILLREPQGDGSGRSAEFQSDASIRVLACPGIQREVEVIANEIWDLVMKDNGAKRKPDNVRLRFNEIAVIIADNGEFDTYRTHIASVFKEIHDIPHNITDVSLTGESRVVEAIDLLLSLPLSRFSREDLLRLMTHPSVLCRFPVADSAQWISWCDGAGILHGADHTDHKETYIEKDLYNWDQGLRRLVLGIFMSGSRSGDTRAFSMDGSRNRYLPEECPQGSLQNASLFLSLARSLIADAHYASQSRLTLSDWSQFIKCLVSTYVGAETPDDERVLTRCLGSVASLKELDLDGSKVSFRIAKEFVATMLASFKGSRGQYLANGVVVSSFLPMRPIPFKVVFIAGLGEGRFPAREMKDPMDLRGARRQAGDVSPRERDQYMFLETLISTREKLYLSYVARDGQTGEPLEPSSVVKELLFILEKSYLRKDGLDKKIVRHPLRRYDDAYFPEPRSGNEALLKSYSPAARSEAWARHLARSLRRSLKTGSLGDLTVDHCHGLPHRVKRLLGFCQIPDNSQCKVETSISLSLSKLRRFLECPLQGWASYQLGLRDDALDDSIGQVDEVFATGYLDRAALLREVFVEAWSTRSQETASDVFLGPYSRRSAFMELKGLSPTGAFAEAERKAHLSMLNNWMRRCAELGLSGREKFEVFRFGRAEETVSAPRISEPICLDVNLGDSVIPRPLRVELHGRTDAASVDVPGSLVLLARDKDKCYQKYLFRSFLDCVFLLLADRFEPGTFRAMAAWNDHAEAWDFGPLSKSSAERYVSGIVREILLGTHSYLLPIEAVMEYRLNNKKGKPFTEIVGWLRDGSWNSYSSRYGPVPHPEDYSPPEEADAERMIQRRFGLFFELLGSKQGKGK